MAPSRWMSYRGEEEEADQALSWTQSPTIAHHLTTGMAPSYRGVQEGDQALSWTQSPTKAHYHMTGAVSCIDISNRM